MSLLLKWSSFRVALATRGSRIVLLAFIITLGLRAVSPAVVSVAAGTAVAQVHALGGVPYGAIAVLVLFLFVNEFSLVAQGELAVLVQHDVDGEARSRARSAYWLLEHHAFEKRHLHEAAVNLSRLGSQGAKRSLGVAAVSFLLGWGRYLRTFITAMAIILIDPALGGILLASAFILQWLLRLSWREYLMRPAERQSEHHRLSMAIESLAFDDSRAVELRFYQASAWLRRMWQPAEQENGRTQDPPRRTRIVLTVSTLATAAIGTVVPAQQFAVGALQPGDLVQCLTALTALVSLGRMTEVMQSEMAGDTVDAYRTLLTAGAQGSRGCAHFFGDPGGEVSGGRVLSFAADRLILPMQNESHTWVVSFRIAAPGLCLILGANAESRGVLLSYLSGNSLAPTGRLIVQSGYATVDIAEARFTDICYVPRIPGRFDITVRDYVSFGSPRHRLDDEGVCNALRQAGLLDDTAGVRLSIDDRLSSSGGTGLGLSGGQWQRLSLARAYFAFEYGCRTFIFDSPTDNLDSPSVRSFVNKVKAMAITCTVIVASADKRLLHLLGDADAISNIKIPDPDE